MIEENTTSVAAPSVAVKRSVVVVRHGERMDYTMRDQGKNWIPTSQRPWDPPLTEHGHEQANALGTDLPNILESLQLPPIAAVYSSPFLRCCQTAAGLSTSEPNLRVKVELGLAESMNENWYRSWAVPGSDGSWGYKKNEIPLADLGVDTLHRSAKRPVQEALDWKVAVSNDTATKARIDVDHESKSSLETPYCMHPAKFESFNMQRARMHETMLQLSVDHANETIVMVSHGGPVTHLYESLTGNKWDVHGVAKYCCYSIYQQIDKDETWTPVVVNQLLQDSNKQSTPNPEGSSDGTNTFTWA